MLPGAVVEMVMVMVGVMVVVMVVVMVGVMLPGVVVVPGNQLLDNVYFTVAKLITKKGVWVPGAICHRSHGRILVNTAIARTESRLPLFLMYTLQYPPEINQK